MIGEVINGIAIVIGLTCGYIAIVFILIVVYVFIQVRIDIWREKHNPRPKEKTPMPRYEFTPEDLGYDINDWGDN